MAGDPIVKQCIAWAGVEASEQRVLAASEFDVLGSSHTDLMVEELGYGVEGIPSGLPQIAVAYILSQPLNIYALIGCNSGAEFQANLKASELQLTPEESAWLDLNRDER